MSQAMDNLQRAMEHAAAILPNVGGFPHRAETLRKAGVTRNVWTLPSCQSIFLTISGPVVTLGTPLVTGAADVPKFDGEALIKAQRRYLTGESTYQEFLEASWRAGVVRYEVDFAERTITYNGCEGEEYVEVYQAVEI